MTKVDSVFLMQKIVKNFTKERDWEVAHNPKNLSMSIAIEAAELMEIFQWKTVEESKETLGSSLEKRISEELADVLIYCFSMANHYNFKVDEIIKEKIKKNSLKYPI